MRFNASTANFAHASSNLMYQLSEWSSDTLKGLFKIKFTKWSLLLENIYLYSNFLTVQFENKVAAVGYCHIKPLAFFELDIGFRLRRSIVGIEENFWEEHNCNFKKCYSNWRRGESKKEERGRSRFDGRRSTKQIGRDELSICDYHKLLCEAESD